MHRSWVVRMNNGSHLLRWNMEFLPTRGNADLSIHPPFADYRYYLITKGHCFITNKVCSKFSQLSHVQINKHVLPIMICYQNDRWFHRNIKEFKQWWQGCQVLIPTQSRIHRRLQHQSSQADANPKIPWIWLIITMPMSNFVDNQFLIEMK